jgi:hypothetical protein
MDTKRISHAITANQAAAPADLVDRITNPQHFETHRLCALLEAAELGIGDPHEWAEWLLTFTCDPAISRGDVHYAVLYLRDRFAPTPRLH